MYPWIAVAFVAALGFALVTQSGASGYNLTLGAGVLAISGLAAVIFQVQRPFAGIAVLIVSAAAFPMHIGEGGRLNAPLALAALVCGCWLVRELLVKKRLTLTASPVVGTLLGLMAAAVASFFAGRIQWYSVPGAATTSQIGGLLMFLLSGGLLLAVAHQLRTVVELKKMTFLFLGAGSIVPFLMIFPQLDPIAAPTVSPITVGSNFWVWLVGMGAAQAWFNKSLSIGARRALLVVVAVALCHGLFQRTDWASGWVPPLIALAVIGAVRFPRTTVCAAAAGGVVGLYAVQKIVAGFMSNESYSLASRLDAWDTLWQIIQKSPIFGSGLSNYYHFTRLYSTSGWYVRFSSHNNYIDLVAQTGFVGLFFFLAFGLAALMLLFRLKAEVSGDFERAYVIGCLGCVIASLASGMLGDWIIPFVYNVGLKGFRSSLLFWVFVGGALMLWKLRDEQWRAPERAPSPQELPSPLALEGGFRPLELEPPI